MKIELNRKKFHLNRLAQPLRERWSALYKKIFDYSHRLIFFNRRSSRSLVGRIMLLHFIWGIFIYVLSVTGMWWASSRVIDDNLQQQATQWVEKFDELATSLYATHDEKEFDRIKKTIEKHPEVSYVRYYTSDGTEMLAEYHNANLEENDIVKLTEQELVQLKLKHGSEAPYLFTDHDFGSSIIRISAPVWIKSPKTDGMLDFDPDIAITEEEGFQLIGFIDAALDFSVYQQRLIHNIIIGSLIIAALLAAAAVLGRQVIKKALLPLNLLQEPLAKLANGETNVTVESTGDEEIQAISKALNTTISALQERDEKLKRLANYDRLTGLYNRHTFSVELEEELSVIAKTKNSSALLFIDLDNFKIVNDALGHIAGDQLLIQVSELLSSKVRKEDIIARFGGDEFTMLVRGVNEKGAISVAESILKAMRDFIFIQEGQSFNVGCSIGVALMNSDRYSSTEIFSQADSACFKAKTNGRNGYQLHKESKGSKKQEIVDVGWSQKINHALKNDKFKLVYQPIIDVDDGLEVMYEVLLRMKDKNRLIMPNAFLPIAERFGLSIDIDHWVINNALRKLAEYRKIDKEVRFSINLSAQVFQDGELTDILEGAFKKYKMPRDSVIFEISEQTVSRNIERATQKIQDLSDIGFCFALDNFGTSFSSFYYLKKLPVEYIKIEGNLVEKMGKNKVDKILIQSIVKIAQASGKKTIAGYVENEELLDMLRKSDVDLAQGFYIAKPNNKITRHSKH